MNEEQSREVFCSLMLIIAIPVQILAMITHGGRGILDWIILGALLVWFWAHGEMYIERMKRDQNKPD